MIDRYSITLSPEKIEERFKVDVPSFYQPHYNASPSQLLPVITSENPKGVSLFYWGKPPEWAANKTLSERIVNLKTENLHDRPNLKMTLLKNRCLVPADGLYLWKKVGTKTLIPHRYTLDGETPFSLAGIWEEFENEEGQTIHTFVIITTPNSELENPDHHFRFPVIFTAEKESIWLNAVTPVAELDALLTPCPIQLFRCYTVSPKIGSPEADYPSLIQPVPPSDQFGNLTLFD